MIQHFRIAFNFRQIASTFFFVIHVLFSSTPAGASPIAQALGVSKFMAPQPTPTFGPWFEGWYIRVIDHEKKLSFATITTSSTHEKLYLNGKKELPGYKALVVAPQNSNHTFSTEEFPERTELVRSITPTDQLWKDEHGSLLTYHSLDFRMSNGLYRVQLQFGEHSPWNRSNPDWGPAGIVGFSNLMPLQWFVVSLKTPVAYRLTTQAGVVEGRGYAHIEKNWGRVFPKAWMWLQNISADGEHQFAIAGGRLGLGPVDVTAFLIGIRGPNGLEINMHPAQGPHVRVRTAGDPCLGEFLLEARDFRYRVQLSAQARISTFVPLAIPTSDGYVSNLAEESFYSSIRIQVYDMGALIYDYTHQDAALEFGADYICQK